VNYPPEIAGNCAAMEHLRAEVKSAFAGTPYESTPVVFLPEGVRITYEPLPEIDK
jgi:hypothetical protein